MVMVLAVAGMLSAMTAMRFAIRGQEVEVPDLEGMVQIEAMRILTEVELGFELDSRRFSDTIPEGQILSQSPAPGARVKSDRSVRVLLSLGARQFPVPEVAGASFRSAQILLNQRGLSVGNTVYSHTGQGDASTVVYQRPEAGDIGADDPAVNVLVSLGPIEQYYVMPDLTEQAADALVTRMRSEGFRLGEITYFEQVGMSPGRVVGQQPAAGYKISKNDVINLEVSQ
jgi:beta-lactam-binding protein with PASTA domain